MKKQRRVIVTTELNTSASVKELKEYYAIPCKLDDEIYQIQVNVVKEEKKK
jgi:hypothetical protein